LRWKARRRMKRLKNFLFGHPLAKAIGLGLFGILGNVLSGAYIFEITDTANGVQFIDWRDSVHSRSFCGLVVVLALMGLYGWGMARFEGKLRRELDVSELAAKALEELLRPMIRKAEADIKAGKIRSMEELRKMFTIDRGQL